MLLYLSILREICDSTGPGGNGAFVMTREWKWCMSIVFMLACCCSRCRGWHAHPYMSASELHEYFASAAWASSLHEAPCEILIEDNVYVDPDVLKPLTIFNQNCTIRGAHPGVILMFPRPEPVLLMEGNVTIRFENLIIRHQLPISLMAMFNGIVALGPEATFEAHNVTLSMDAKSLEWLEHELHTLGTPGVQTAVEKSSEGNLLLKWFTRGSLSLQNVKAVVQELDELHGWPSPAHYIVDNAAMFIHRLLEAEKEAEGWMGSDPVEISVRGSITLTVNDLPDGQPLRIRRKVVIVGVGNGAVLKLGFNLTKQHFLSLVGNGCVVTKSLAIEFFSNHSGEGIAHEDLECKMCNIITALDSPIHYEDAKGFCQLNSINTVLRTDCHSIKRLNQVLQAIDTTDSPLLIKELGPGDEWTVQIEGWKGHGACMMQTNITCMLASESTVDGAEPAYADEDYVKQRYAEIESVTETKRNSEMNDQAHSKKGGLEKYGLTILSILIGANLVLVGTIAWSKWGRQRQHAKSSKKLEPELPLGVVPMASPGVDINPSGTSYHMVGNFEGIRSDSTLTADTGQELLHKIYEERRGIGDETMELQEQVGSGKFGTVYHL